MSTAITTSTDPEDVWMKSGLYTFPTYTKSPTGVITDKRADTIVSSSAEDHGPHKHASAGGGGGAHSVYISGYDQDFNFIEEEVSLEGTTVVSLKNKYYRINEATVIDTGTTINALGFTSNIGHISIYNNGVGTGTPAAYISELTNDHMSSIYTVNNDLYLDRLTVMFATEAIACNVVLYVGKRGMMTARWSTLVEKPADINSTLQGFEFKNSLKIPRWSDMKVIVTTVSGTITQLSVTYEGHYTHPKPSRISNNPSVY